MTSTRQKQCGLTLWGLLGVLIMVGILGLLTMRLVPVYLAHFEVVHSAENLNLLTKTEPGIWENPSVGRVLLQQKFMNQLYVNGVEHLIKPQNVAIRYEKGFFLLTVSYDTTVPFVGNIDLLIHFRDEVKVNRSESDS